MLSQISGRKLQMERSYLREFIEEIAKDRRIAQAKFPEAGFWIVRFTDNARGISYGGLESGAKRATSADSAFSCQVLCFFLQLPVRLQQAAVGYI